jgi:hypothetical protein
MSYDGVNNKESRPNPDAGGRRERIPVRLRVPPGGGVCDE